MTRLPLIIDWSSPVALIANTAAILAIPFDRVRPQLTGHDELLHFGPAYGHEALERQPSGHSPLMK